MIKQELVIKKLLDDSDNSRLVSKIVRTARPKGGKPK